MADDPTKIPSTLPSPPDVPQPKDPVTGLPIVNGRIDLSNGIPLSDAQRAGILSSRAMLLQALEDHAERDPSNLESFLELAATLIATLSEVLPFLPVGETEKELSADVLAILQKAILGHLNK